ncbi:MULTISPECIES: RNA 2',3'-cyclic phosphodiesterase [Paenibacillus]|uniref:RNA 2',3'-cyclic phosphodiesterase n=1 Tax=Paenibacillus TaxID=44249 RepID=UPI0022B8BA5F|nr:RNA 2',3'-cyclic phosphodiesterase [Paenibacillus caseinilyticus]MCZ8519297.1 RNA 2',3'-cyclic phosphodiesterase [Paenibacillus caseinilyticus]
MESTLRLFAAVGLPGELKASLGEWMHRMKGTVPFRKWVHPEDLHITLQFLGEVGASRSREIEQALEVTAARSRPFQLQLGSIGTFGKTSAPSILWVGLSGELEELRVLHEQVEKAMSGVGFQAEERKFQPHITLARTYQGIHSWDREQQINTSLPEACLVPWQTDQLILYRSRLGHQPMYEPVRIYALNHADE